MGEALEVTSLPPLKPQDVEVELMSVDAITNYWPQICQELDLVGHIWQRWWTKDTLYQAAISGQCQVWSVGSSTQVRLVVFSQILTYPRLTVF